MVEARIKFGWRRASGQAALELALLTPILALLLLICGDSMRVYRTVIELDGVAQAGAAYAQSPLSAGNQNGILDASGLNRLRLDDAAIASSTFCRCAGDGADSSCNRIPLCPGLEAFVRVEARATFHTLIHYPGIASSLRLKSVAVRRVE